MISGYSIIDSIIDGVPQAAVTIDDRITKEDLIEWGWARGPVKIDGRPEKRNPKALGYPAVYSNEEEAERDVKLKNAFKLGEDFFVLKPIAVFRNHGSYGTGGPPSQPYRDSPWEGFYWVNENWKAEVGLVLNDDRFKLINALPKSNSATNPDAEELIAAALSAPVVDGEKRDPYYGQWITAGNEVIDFTLWIGSFARGVTTVVERNKIPGLGYQYPITKVRGIGEWTKMTGGEEYLNRPMGRFIVHFPNCEIGPNFCVSFSFDHDNKLYYEMVTRRFIWTSIVARDILYPENIRRMPMPRFQPRTATEKVSCYVLNREEEKKFVDKLSTKTLNDQVKSFLYGDGSGSILGLKWFYGIRPAISTTQKRKITIGNFTIDDLSVPVFAGDFVQVYMGYVFVRGPFGDYRDYTDARYQMFVPQLGHIDLEPSRVVRKNVHLLYTVNLTDGSAVVTVATTEVGASLVKENGWYETMDNIFTTSITYGYDIPLNVDSVKDVSVRIGEITSKAIVGGVAGAIAGNVPGALLGVAAAASSTNAVQSTYSSGSLAPNSNVMGDFTPKIYVKFNKGTAGDISSAVGYPCGKLVKVGEASGYLKAAMVYGTPTTTMQHTDEIVNMLKEGIYIS